MASTNTNPIFKDGGSSSKPPLFSGEYFNFKKIRMKAHLEAQGEGIWRTIQDGLNAPTSSINCVGTPKIKALGMKMIREKI